jgi:hypothetical protein
MSLKRSRILNRHIPRHRNFQNRCQVAGLRHYNRNKRNCWVTQTQRLGTAISAMQCGSNRGAMCALAYQEMDIERRGLLVPHRAAVRCGTMALS